MKKIGCIHSRKMHYLFYLCLNLIKLFWCNFTSIHLQLSGFTTKIDCCKLLQKCFMQQLISQNFLHSFSKLYCFNTIKRHYSINLKLSSFPKRVSKFAQKFLNDINSLSFQNLLQWYLMPYLNELKVCYCHLLLS